MVQKKIVEGAVVSGRYEAKFFTDLDWVKKQLKEKFGFDPFPGTLNLKIESEEYNKLLQELRKHPGVELVPPSPDFCRAVCFRVKVNGKVEGVIVLPHVQDYYTNILEVIAPVKLRDEFNLKDGDKVTLEIEI
ncbi:hypothetical protein DRO26_03685 [Candidatus Bathyarchaeota archaeon]|nr:MAG: hypothetical protein DRO26_03685 [Candidatus Bathyarchaeota archaeon]